MTSFGGLSLSPLDNTDKFRHRCFDRQKMHVHNTIKENEFYTFGHFRCKMAIFKWEWKKVKVLPRP